MASLDLAVVLWMARHRTGVIDGLAHAVLELSRSRSAVALAAVICVVLTVIAQRARPLITVTIAVAASFLASMALKSLFQVSRPAPDLALVYAPGWAFPSTDAAITAAAAAALYLTVTWVRPDVRRRLAWVLISFVVVVGALLVYVGAHWPSDVLAGWCLGGAVGAGIAHLARRVTPSRG